MTVSNLSLCLENGIIARSIMEFPEINVCKNKGKMFDNCQELMVQTSHQQ